MKIQIRHDDHIRTSQKKAAHIEATLRDVLEHYSNLITDLEVHLSDKNGAKFAGADKRCLIEARLAHRRPIEVSDGAETVDQAVRGASGKLERSIAHIVGKMRSQ